MVYAVVPDQKLVFFGFVCTVGTFEGCLLGQVQVEPFKEVLVGAVPLELDGVDEG